ncbi:winged helix-turn-helix transcriptional regulator [Paludibaculum fermentans]|uniref:winged helix-turn-helix transcriptional regulator n=1 Tax=Paludibaculum fermentans TaxID=1473598 RepID=UPI003EB9ADB2
MKFSSLDSLIPGIESQVGTLMSDSHLLETKAPWDVFNSKCPTRQVLDRIADKWTVLVIRRLSCGTMRFAQIRRSVDGISQKVLTNTLRSLERDGLVTRKIYASVPPRVEYTLTDLGYSLCDLVGAICGWAEANIERVQAARALHDQADGTSWREMDTALPT